MDLHMTTPPDKRKSERLPATLPITIGSAVGVTRDLSPTGVYFEVGKRFEVNDQIRFLIDLADQKSKMVLDCSGTVVRTDRLGQTTGVAVSITESVLSGEI